MDLVEIICILDKSGSMAPRAQDAIGGFNTFLKEQKALPGKALLSLTLFDTQVTQVHAGKDLQDVPDLDTSTYIPGGFTALLDAVGSTLAKAEERHASMPEAERPKRVLTVIITDGQENASREFDRKGLHAKIEACKAKGWEFSYLGATPSTFQDAASIGLAHAAQQYDSGNIRGAYMGMSVNSVAFRTKK